MNKQLSLALAISFLLIGASHATDRIGIEIIPVSVTGPGEIGGTEIVRLMGNIRTALDVLGVPYNRYNLTLADGIDVLNCQTATMGMEQPCHTAEGEWMILSRHLQYTRWSTEDPLMGNIRFLVYLVPDGFAWRGIQGTAALASWSFLRDRRAHNSACLAWALNTPQTITHELGHCLGPRRCGEDPDMEIDIMKSVPGYRIWVKESNLEKVQYHLGARDISGPEE